MAFDEPIGVIAGAADRKAICATITDRDNMLFRQYANNYELIRIKGSFLTEF